MADPVNNVLTNDEITLRALMHFRNSCKAVKLADQQHAGAFANKGGQIGNTIKVRKPDFGEVYKTRTRTLSKIDEEFANLTLNRWRGTAFKLTSDELLLDINSLDQASDQAAHAQAGGDDRSGSAGRHGVRGLFQHRDARHESRER